MQLSRARTVGCAAVASVIAFASGLAAPAPSSAESVTPDIPILGQAWTVGVGDEGEPAVLSVHGVRRVEGATVVYWSIGVNTYTDLDEFMGTSQWHSYDAPNAQQGNLGLVDQAGRRVFRPLYGSSGTCVCSSDDPEVRKGQARVLWSAVVPMPPEVDTVDVVIGQQIIPDIPVEDGPMEPLASDQQNIVLGMGWPKIDDAKIKQGKTPDPAFFALTSRVSDLQETVTKSRGEISLNASVLFAKDAFAAITFTE